MRRYATFFLVAVMTFGLVVLLLSRSRTAYDAPAEVLEARADAAANATGADAAAQNAAPATNAGHAGAVAPKPAEPPIGDREARRPMRVATLGWELAAPAAADAGAVEVAPEPALDAVEARLARGGADPAGADLAIIPLPAFVSAYDRLRALEPRAFLVVGFSRGREELHAAPGALTKPPPAAEEVKLVALAPPTAGEPAAKAAGSESATVLGLFALDLLGVAPSRVRFVAPGSEVAKAAPLAAIVRGAADDRRLALSTADASRLVPLVAVAPKAQLDAAEARYRAFAKEWLEALGRAGTDAPGVARRLASKDGVPLAPGTGGAPEAIALVERLGLVEPATAADQAALFGQGPDVLVGTGRAPVTLESLAQRTWQLARAGGLVASAAPDPLPIDGRIAAAVAAPKPGKPRAPAEPDAGLGSVPQGATPLVTYRAPAGSSSDAVADQIGFLSWIFERAVFRISARGGEKAARAIAAQVEGRFDVPAARLSVTAAEPQGAFATVEILSLP